MNLEERFSAARTELDAMFSNTDVPPAGGVRTRHRRRLAARYGAMGLAALTLVFGTAAIVNNGDKEPVVADDSSTPTPASTSTTVPAVTATLVITAGPDLTFTPSELTVRASSAVRIRLVGAGGTAALTFERAGVLPETLVVDASNPRADGVADLSLPGEYVFFSPIAGHREAGMEGRIIVTDEGNPPTVTTTTTAPSVLGTAHPAGLIGATSDGRIVEINDDGSIGRELLQIEGVPIAEMQVVDNTLYYRANFGECGSIDHIPLTGGEPEVWTNIAVDTFAFSPDGKYLAYFRTQACGGTLRGSGGELAIENIETGEVATWVTPETSDDFFEVNSIVSDLVWSPDSTTVAATWCYEGCAIQLHDPEANGTFTYADTIEGEHPAYLDRVMWASRSYYGETPENEPLALLRYDTPAAPEVLESPFTTLQLTKLLPGGDGTLVGIVGGFADVPLRVESWVPSNPTVDDVAIDPAIAVITTR